jgi:5-methylcytosine-specific restriction endonuclease McrA
MYCSGGIMADQPEVRYQENGDNRLLRHVLVDLWNQQCYWCRRFKDYADLQIDHVLPRTAGKSKRDGLQRAFDMEASYDVNALYNLAPICGTCNRQKNDTDLTGYGVVLTTLRKAKKIAPKVAHRIESFGTAFDLGAALLHVAEADLNDKATRAMFEREAPAVVQRLAELVEWRADFYAFRTVDVETRGVVHTVSLMLNERARAALTVLKEVAGGRLENALSAPLSDLLDRVGAAAANALKDYDYGLGVPNVEPGDADWAEITIGEIQFNGIPPARLEFEFSGDFDAVVSASIARNNPFDGDLEHVQGEAVVNGSFTFSFAWEPTDPIGVFYFDQVFLQEWDAQLWIEGDRYVPLKYILDFFGRDDPDEG